MTGKGVSWGRDSVGRSAPAFMAASTTALPPLTCTEGKPSHRQLLFRCETGHLWAVRFEACAGRRVRRLCLPAVPVLQAFVLPALPILPAMPTALLNSCPRPVSFAPVKFACPRSFALFAPCSLPCAPGSSSVLGPAVCKLRELSRWQLQHGPAVAARAPVHLTASFSCRVHDPGPWVSVDCKLSCVL